MTPQSPRTDALARAEATTASQTYDLNRRFPIVMDRAEGAYVWDTQGERYLDLTSCSGAAPLGSGFRPVIEHVSKEMVRTGGILPGPISLLRVEVAELLLQMFPWAGRATFLRTGSCATTAAVRLARVHAGKRTVLTSGYHGWHDWHLQDREPMGLVGRDVQTFDFLYDIDVLHRLAKEHGDVAAVIVTPEVNFFPPQYARALEAATREIGALFIIDEVMTGFRYAQGGYHHAIGLTPDLIALSKGLTNGMALSAVLGTEVVMTALDETYLGNTYQREVTPFAAAIATAQHMSDGSNLQRIMTVGQRLMDGLNGVFEHAEIRAVALAHPSMFDVLFADPALGREFCQSMWRRGILMQYGGRQMPSAAIADVDITFVVEQAELALKEALVAVPSQNSGSGDAALHAAAQRFAADAFKTTSQTVEKWFRCQTPGWWK